MPLIKAGAICLALLVACSSSEEGGEDVAECWDEIDNDGDGLIDCDDAGCIVLGICEGKIDTGEDVPDDQPEFCDPCE